LTSGWKLRIEAAPLESADGLVAALSEFRAELVDTRDDKAQVTISLRSDRDIVDALSAIERHLTERRDAAARIELDGRSYTMHPTPST
jgi:hypothetical protein